MSLTNTIGYHGIFADEHWKRCRFQDKVSFCPKTREAASVIIDGNSIVRNSTSAVQSVSSLPPIVGTLVAGSSVLGGVLGIPIGLSAVRDGFIKGRAAYDAGDREGVSQNALWATAGAGYAGVSILLATAGFIGLSAKGAPAALLPAFSGLGLVMSGAFLGFGGYGLAAATRFKNALQKSETEGGQKGVLDFLNRQISLTPQEIMGKSDAEIAQNLQKKWNALERKVGVSCTNEIRQTLPALLQSFDPEKGEKLITAVKKANFKERIKHIILIVIALVSALAFTALLLTTGPFSPLLFVLTAGLWLTIDSSKLHDAIGEKCWAWHCKRKQMEQRAPCPVPLKEIFSITSA